VQFSPVILCNFTPVLTGAHVTEVGGHDDLIESAFSGFNALARRELTAATRAYQLGLQHALTMHSRSPPILLEWRWRAICARCWLIRRTESAFSR
jgi:hypothetical protein